MTEPRMVDLFCGIGGFRLAFDAAGCRCVASYDIDRFAAKTYEANHGDPVTLGDFRQVPSADVPDFDVLAAGFPCFVAGTMVLTADGYRPIETIKAGDLVWTHLGRWKPVVSTSVRDDVPTRSFKAGGIPITTTDEHPFLVRKRNINRRVNRKYSPVSFDQPEWVVAKDLTSDFRCVQPNIPVSIVNDDHTAEFWWLIGNYVAEGWIRKRYDRKTKDHGIVLCCHPDDTDYVCQKVRLAGFHPCIDEGVMATKIHIMNVDLSKLVSEFGSHAHEKRIPLWVHSIGPSERAAFLDGYMFGDGTEHQPNPRGAGTYRTCTTVSKTLALDLILMIQGVHGVVPSITVSTRNRQCKIDGRIVHELPTWNIRIPHLNRGNIIIDDVGHRLIKTNVSGPRCSVYNIQVADDESYVADGVVVHNCPSFSRSGVSKRNSMGKAHGFTGEGGDLFFEIVRLLRDKRPRAALLENVKHLIHHGKPRGSTFQTVLDHLHDVGYRTSWVLTDAVRVVPQMRWRVYIACIRDDVDVEFDVSGVEIPDLRPKLRDILEPDPDPSLVLTDHYWNYMQEYRAKHRERGSNFGYHMPDLDGPSRALMARYYKDGSEILIDRGPGLNPRKLSVREAARLMGYPDTFEFPVSKTQAYKQLGNSVVVPLVTPMAKAVVGALGGIPVEPRFRTGLDPSPDRSVVQDIFG